MNDIPVSKTRENTHYQAMEAMKPEKLRFKCKVPFLLLLLGLSTPWMQAQEQFQGYCARVKIEILQELTTERIGFEATLEVTNNDSLDSLTDFAAELTFEDPELSTEEETNDASDLFFVRAPSLETLNSIEGTGVIGPTKTGIVRWFIIPKIDAGGTDPRGKEYKVGCRLSGKLAGEDIPKESMFVIPDDITVLPDPQLEITYFQPRDVQGDDPFTAEVESPIPFTLGVIVKNGGFGPARDVKIDSQQPKIVDNKLGLLLVARLLGARVDDSPLDETSLLVDLGDILPGEATKGAWDMITSLSGSFIEFKASYTHASELGGLETSIIRSLEAHFIAHEVLHDLPGSDEILDFLADVDRDDEQMPDTLYENNGNQIPVNEITQAVVTEPLFGLHFTLEASPTAEGWGYLRINDPGQGRLDIESVVRSDGKVINPHNSWTNVRYAKANNQRLAFFNLLDFVDLQTYQYSINYSVGGIDSTPPETRLRFSGELAQDGNGTYFIQPSTQLFFTSEDENPVSIVYKLGDGNFLPALPFNLTERGLYTITYFATDSTGNQEDEKTAVVSVGESGLAITQIESSANAIFSVGETLSLRPRRSLTRFTVSGSPFDVRADIDIFEGVLSWPRLIGIPSSPTPNPGAVITVAGSHVDFYRYRINEGDWSTETSAGNPIDLTGLDGEIRLEVQGRSMFNSFEDGGIISTLWVVDANAPILGLQGAPSHPSLSGNATISLLGVTDYQWKIDEAFFYPETPVATPIELPPIEAGDHVLGFVGRRDGAWQSGDNPTTYSWTYDPLYGSDYSGQRLVRSEEHLGVQGETIDFMWDGLDDEGISQPPGWYSIRVTLIDELGQRVHATRLVRIGELTDRQNTIADRSRGAKNPFARGQWLVWQERHTGTWNIAALRVGQGDGSPIAVTNAMTSQENPSTDGPFAVWQGRQINGNWDIFMADLDNPGSITQITDTGEVNETMPVIDWPWIVYQAKSSSDSDAVWQLHALNLDNGASFAVHPGPQDQLDPSIHRGRVVWQDHRDPGQGEIYFRDLESNDVRRLTDNSFGQYFPIIDRNMVVWQDNRDLQVDIYGYNLLQNREIRLTDTPFNETRPQLSGHWLIVQEDSRGANTGNLRLVDTRTLGTAPLTSASRMIRRGMFVGNSVAWEVGEGDDREITVASVPALQTYFRNNNTVAVTHSLVETYGDAFTLLENWNEEAGVVEISRFASLTPTPVRETASWNPDLSAPEGTNFTLESGRFLWIRFADKGMLDLGTTDEGQTLDLQAGLNAVGFSGFPTNYTAYQLIDQLGMEKVSKLRVLDADRGNWNTILISDGRRLGPDFILPHVSVILIEMIEPVSGFIPE